MKNFRILLDLDGVLGDFCGAALRVHGVSFKDWQSKQPPGEWDMTIGLQMSHTKFWKPIEKMGSRFWSAIEPLPWAKDLIKLVQSFTDDWLVVTTPSLSVTSYVGKIHWLRQQFGRNFKRFELITNKSLLANAHTLLLDDCKNNCKRFQEAGGHAMLVPSPSNCLYGMSVMEFIQDNLQWFSDSYFRYQNTTFNLVPTTFSSLAEEQ